MSFYPMFYEHDVPESIGDIENIAEHFGIYITDHDIWNTARHSEKPPHLGNVYLDILFSRLDEKLRETYPEICTQYEVNALASYFYVNDQRFSSVEELFELIEQD